MRIRPEEPRDVAPIRAVLEAAFPGPDEARLVEQLRRDGDAELSLVAIAGEALVGHIMFSPMKAPFRALSLAPVAVLPERQRVGIGVALIRDGLDRAKAAGWQGVFVLGEPDYYGRFGFTAIAASGFASPYAGPYLMALSLQEESLPVSTGDIHYAKAFARLG
jgi:putative acetyltransferase